MVSLHMFSRAFVSVMTVMPCCLICDRGSKSSRTSLSSNCCPTWSVIFLVKIRLSNSMRCV